MTPISLALERRAVLETTLEAAAYLPDSPAPFPAPSLDHPGHSGSCRQIGRSLIVPEEKCLTTAEQWAFIYTLSGPGPSEWGHDDCQ